MPKQKRILVCGAGGFIGGHLVKRLKESGHWVRGVDIKEHEYKVLESDEFILGDLRDKKVIKKCFKGKIDEVYQLAADMGGAGYIFTGNHDADVMHNSAMVNLNVLEEAKNKNVKKIFYSSSACIYPEEKQLDPNNQGLKESDAYPANPDSEYGWEKLFSERLYFSYMRNYGINVKVVRFHNVYGPLGSWNNGKEKSPAAVSRKVAESEKNNNIEIWGDGNQTRTFLYIDDCLDAIELFMNSDFNGPLNVGTEELISINDLAKMVIGFSGKNVGISNIPGPVGVRGRSSNNDLIREKLSWEPKISLENGMKKLYCWICEQRKLLC